MVTYLNIKYLPISNLCIPNNKFKKLFNYELITNLKKIQ